MSFRQTRDRENKGLVRNNTEMGTITSSGEKIAALGAGEYRDITLIAPYGINWNPDNDVNVQLVKNLNSPVDINAVGCPVKRKLKPGELEMYGKASSIYLRDDGSISIAAKGGASIVLQADGSILMNGHLKINSDGTTVIV